MDLPTIAVFLLAFAIFCLMGWIWQLYRIILVLEKKSETHYKDLSYDIETLDKEVKAELLHIEAFLYTHLHHTVRKEKEKKVGDVKIPRPFKLEPLLEEIAKSRNEGRLP